MSARWAARSVVAAEFSLTGLFLRRRHWGRAALLSLRYSASCSPAQPHPGSPLAILGAALTSCPHFTDQSAFGQLPSGYSMVSPARVLTLGALLRANDATVPRKLVLLLGRRGPC